MEGSGTLGGNTKNEAFRLLGDRDIGHVTAVEALRDGCREGKTGSVG